MRFVVRKDVYKSICDMLGIEKAGLPVNTRHGNYVKTCDNPVTWEYKPLQRKKPDIQEKTFTELTEKEKKELKEKLLKQNYRLIDGIYVAESKLKREDPITLNQEINNAKNLIKQGHKVYLLPFGFATKKEVRSPDTLTDNRFLEMKDVMEDSSLRTVRDDLISAKGQGEDVYINIHKNLSHNDVEKEMYRAIGIIKKIYPNNLEGKIYFNFEKQNKTIVYKTNKNGIALKGNP